MPPPRLKKLVEASVTLLVTALALMFGAGCASTKQSVPLPDLSKAIENPAKARIYVFRPFATDGSTRYEIMDRSIKIGEPGANGFVCWERDPGPMVLFFKAPPHRVSQLALNVKAGQTYYIKLKWGWGTKADDAMQLV